MRSLATDTQRALNRSILPQVQSNMAGSYKACLNVPRGSGLYYRMKRAMKSKTRPKVSVMFNESEIALLKGIDDLIIKLAKLIGQTGTSINKHLEDVYSIYWDDQNDRSKIIGPDRQMQVKECRDSLLPLLHQIDNDVGKIQDLVGIERKTREIDIMGTEILKKSVKRRVDKATDKGEIIDLYDSDVDIDELLKKLPPRKRWKPVDDEKQRIIIKKERLKDSTKRIA